MHASLIKRMAAVALSFGLACGVHGSPLSDLAAAMHDGEWRVLNQGGDGSGWNHALLATTSDTVLNYADKALWSPLTGELHFLGKGCCGQDFRFLSYSAGSNHWQQQPKPFWDCSPQVDCRGHGYEHSTLDPATGDVFWRQFNSTAVYRWARATGLWTQLPSAPNPAVAVAIEYVPDLNGLVLVGAGQVHLYTHDSGWTRLVAGLTMGPYHNIASYSPAQGVLVFGGGNGSRRLYTLDALRVIRALPDAPIDVGIMASVLTIEPRSGSVLLFGRDGSLHRLDPGASRWQTLASEHLPLWSSHSNRILFRVAVPILEHGVIAFLTTDRTDSTTRVYLYKPERVELVFRDGFDTVPLTRH